MTPNPRPSHQTYPFESPRPEDRHAFGRDRHTLDDGPSRDMPRRRDSTITATERQTFGRIFDDIIASSHQSPSPLEPTPSTAPESSSRPSAGPDQPIVLTGNAYLDAIFSDRVERANRKSHLSFGPSSPADADAADTAAARLARTTSGNLTSILGIDEPAAVSSTRLAELQRVEDLLRSAKTDLDLWATLEKEVFPLVHTLQEPSPHPPSPPSPSSPSSTFSTQPSALEDNQPDDKLSRLATVCANYPYLLLVAFRLLAHDFATPPTCRALFAHIKALGPVSHVLGASTALYHEMIDLAWQAYRDPSAAADLLREMDRAGLDFDDETGRLLAGMLRGPAPARRLHRSRAAGAAVWETDAFRAGMAQLVEWRRLVYERLDEQQSRDAS